MDNSTARLHIPRVQAMDWTGDEFARRLAQAQICKSAKAWSSGVLRTLKQAFLAIAERNEVARRKAYAPASVSRSRSDSARCPTNSRDVSRECRKFASA